MVTMTIRVEGLSDLQRRMKDLDVKMRTKFIRSAALAGANEIKKAAVRNAPVKTGELKRAISTRRSRKFSDTAKGYEQRDTGIFKVKGGKYSNTRHNRRLGRVGKTFEKDPPSYYWRFLEFGTVKMQPKPFLRPALDQARQSAIEKVKQRLAADIAKVGK